MLFDTSRDWWGLLAYLILLFFIASFYALINQIFVSYFGEVYLSPIIARDYRYFVICYSVVAVFIAVL